MKTSTESLMKMLARTKEPAAILELVVDDPLSSEVIATNRGMDEVVDYPNGASIGMHLSDFVTLERREVANDHWKLLARGQVEGLHRAEIEVVRSDGSHLPLSACIRRMTLEGSPNVAIMVVGPRDGSSAPPFDAFASRAVNAGLLITDSDWKIVQASDRVLADLAIAPGAMIGSSLLEIVHPGDAAEVLAAAIVATESGLASAARARIRRGDDGWSATTMLMGALGEGKTAPLGILFSSPVELDRSGPTRALQLERHLWRISREVRAAGFLPPNVTDRTSERRLERLAELSERQREIVERLLEGQRVPEIAKALFLSPSTVRNHLTEVYRKFHVHSQVDLINALKDDAPAVVSLN